MKTVNKAALLLASATLIFAQASFAGKGDPQKGPNRPVTEDCNFPDEENLAPSVCRNELGAAYEVLGTSRDRFISNKDGGEKDFIGLRCKVARAEVKMALDKTADALAILEESVYKVELLFQQNKLEGDYLINGGDLNEISQSLVDARECIALNQ